MYAGLCQEEWATGRSLWTCWDGVFGRSHSEGHGGAWRATDSVARRGLQGTRVSVLVIPSAPPSWFFYLFHPQFMCLFVRALFFLLLLAFLRFFFLL